MDKYEAAVKIIDDINTFDCLHCSCKEDCNEYNHPCEKSLALIKEMLEKNVTKE